MSEPQRPLTTLDFLAMKRAGTKIVSLTAYDALMARGTMALPSFGSNDGQFPGSAGLGRIVGPPPVGLGERRSLAVLHAALLTMACLRSLGSSRRVVLDGSFTEEPLFAPLPADQELGLRPPA